mmetsp:Transcript_108150/g.207849  ORF Transcript_108150/g.207849 Transcript_108150/m.207849 type:complete len:280 (+) Transcript_108150:43-882(+)
MLRLLSVGLLSLLDNVLLGSSMRSVILDHHAQLVENHSGLAGYPPAQGSKCCWRYDCAWNVEYKWFHWFEQGNYQTVSICPDGWGWSAWGSCDGAKQENKFTYNAEKDAMDCSKGQANNSTDWVACCKQTHHDSFTYYKQGTECDFEHGSYRDGARGMHDAPCQEVKYYNKTAKYECVRRPSTFGCTDYECFEHHNVDSSTFSCRAHHGAEYAAKYRPYKKRYCKYTGTHRGSWRRQFKVNSDHFTDLECAGLPDNCKRFFCQYYSTPQDAAGGCWKNC